MLTLHLVKIAVSVIDMLRLFRSNAYPPFPQDFSRLLTSPRIGSHVDVCGACHMRVDLVLSQAPDAQPTAPEEPADDFFTGAESETGDNRRTEAGAEAGATAAAPSVTEPAALPPSDVLLCSQCPAVAHRGCLGPSDPRIEGDALWMCRTCRCVDMERAEVENYSVVCCMNDCPPQGPYSLVVL